MNDSANKYALSLQTRTCRRPQLNRAVIITLRWLSAAERLYRNYMKGSSVLSKLQGGYANDSYANGFEGSKGYSAK